MAALESLKASLREIDEISESYHAPSLAPDREVGDIVGEQIDQSPLFERAVARSTEALEAFPLHPALLIRRARARRMIVKAPFDYPQAEAAERDLRTALEVDEDNLEAGLELADLLFTFSAMEDAEVADLAAKMAGIAESYVCRIRGLQIRALGYAEMFDQAESVYRRWSKVFPDSEALKDAMNDARSVMPDPSDS